MPTRTTLLLLPLLAALATAQIQYENHGNLGPGNDTFQGGDLNDLVHGGGGDDTLKGGGGQDRMYGDDGNDYLFGEGDDDMLSGGDGNDHIAGGPGCDEIVGGAGNDTVFDGDWNYSHPCSDGKKDKINLVDGVSGNDHVYAGPEDEITADPGDLVTILMPGTDYTIWHGTFAEWQALRPTLILINELLQAGHAHGVAPGDLHDVILELERCGVPIEDQYDVWLMMQANDESFAAWLVLAAQVIASCR